MATAMMAASPVEDEAIGCTIPIDKLVLFENDPRQSPNSEYARIKASIRAQGLDQPLVVTRRPGADHYVIAAGGNTRLKILRELLQETGESQFAQVTCVIKPWRGESEVMLAHLRENDLRGDLSFIDKARGICTARRMLEDEQAQMPLTQAELTERLRTRGYALSQATVSNMAYAVEVLAIRIPTALQAGLPHREVVRFRTFENAARALWTERVPEETTERFDDVFLALCRRYDGPDWDLLSLQQAFEAEVADRLNQTVHAVRLALEARLNGVAEVELPKRDEEDEWWPEPPVPTPPKARLQAIDETHAVPESAPLDEEDQDLTDDSALSVGTDATTEQSDAVQSSSTLQPMAPLDDVPAMRSAIAALARAIAARHGMESLITATPEAGTGYLVTEVPDPTLLAQFDEDGLAQVSMIWWQLMAFAEMTVAPINALLPRLSPDNVLYRAIRDQDAGLLFNAVWTLDPGQVGFRLWRTVGDDDWTDLRALASHYRQLHQAAVRAGVSLWKVTR